MATIESYYDRISPIVKGAPDPMVHRALVDAAREFAAETVMVRRTVTINTTSAQFVASINGYVMTVTAINTGVLVVGQIITGAGIPANVVITQAAAGGGVGNYVLNSSLTLASEVMTGTIQNYPLAVGQEEEVISITSVNAQDSQTPPNIWQLYPSNPGNWNLFISPGPPSNYAFIPYSQISFFPVPDTTYMMSVVVPVQPRQGASVLPDELMRRYDREICDGAIAYLKRVPLKPWTDINGAMVAQNNFLSGISKAKADVIRSFNVGGYFMKRRPFIC